MKIDIEKLNDMMKNRLETNSSLADKMGVNVATVSRILNGRDIKISTMKKLTEALECTVDDLT